MPGDQLLGQRNHVFCLVAIEPDRLDQLAHPGFAELDHLRWSVGELEQRRRRLVDPGIGRLRGQHHGDQQRVRIDVDEFALWLGLRFLEAAERLLYLGGCPLGHVAMRGFDVGLFPRLRRLDLGGLALPGGLDGFGRFSGHVSRIVCVMNANSNTVLEPAIFSAIITPHRSLNRIGFIILMSSVCLVSFIGGIVFLMAGAWPVFGFFGLDVALLYWAFKLNYAQAPAY